MSFSLYSPLLVLGHRGAISDHFGFYQNTLKAFQEAVSGGDGFETDAVVDKDGEVFLIHEAKYVDPAKGVEYCAGEYMDAASAALLGRRRIDELATAETLKLRLKDGSPLPTLKQAIELAGAHGKLINIELKAYDITRHVLRIVKEYLHKGIVTPQSFILSSFNHPALEIVRRETPEIPIGAIFNYPDAPEKPIFPWHKESSGVYMPLVAGALEQEVLKRIRPEYFIMPQEILTMENIAMIAKRYPTAKCAAWVFTERGGFDLPDLLRRLEALQSTGKVAAVLVDNPREFTKALRR